MVSQRQAAPVLTMSKDKSGVLPDQADCDCRSPAARASHTKDVATLHSTSPGCVAFGISFVDRLVRVSLLRYVRPDPLTRWPHPDESSTGRAVRYALQNSTRDRRYLPLHWK